MAMRMNDGLDLDEPDDLIGTGEIAAMWGLNREYVTNCLSKRPDFPQPALRLSRKTVRWRRDDLEAFRAKHSRRK